MTAGNAGHGGHAGGPEALRLSLLASAAEGLSNAEALRLALQQATAGLGGLGGLVHQHDPGSGLLHLVMVSGLGPEIAKAWVSAREDEDTPPARAVRGGGYVWLAGDTMGVGTSGMAAVPLLGPDGPVGALSVLTAEFGEPDRAQRSFLHSVAAWASGRLGGASDPTIDSGEVLGSAASLLGSRKDGLTGSGGGPPVRRTSRPKGGVLTQVRRDSIFRTLRDMSDGFVTVDDDWRITFVNKEAERLLGAGRALLGSVLWDVPASRVQGLEGQCRRASAEGRAIGFDLRWPSDQRLYHVRLVPVRGSGLTISFADVTGLQPGEAAHTATERIAAERTTRMGDLTEALAEAVTSRDVVRAVAERVLPPFAADGLLVQVLEDGRLHVVDSVGYTREFINRYLEGIPLTANSAVTDVLRTRTPRFVESSEEFARFFPELEHVSTASPKNAWVFLPLIASGHAIGCCVVAFTQARSFDDEERTLLTALSGLVAQALERARLYDEEHTRAQRLQHGLLPGTLPSLPAVTASARYLPAGRGGEVGGDWYDLIPLSADRVAMVIGDVMGHGITEAATMGRLRTAVRTLADLEMGPDDLLSRLNEIVGDLGDDYYATCSYAVFDPVAGTCSVSVAGHPPPMIVHPGGTVHSPDLAVNPPLGAAEPPFDVHELSLPDDSLLVFYTDGLVESATRDIDQGMTQLRQTLAQEVARTSYFSTGHPDGAATRLDDLCDVIVSALLPDREQTNDDAALLIARTRRTSDEDVALCDLPEDPRAAGQAREYVRGKLAAWGLDELVMTTELLVSELISNVIRHAKGPMRLRLLRSRSLICEVYDASLSAPRIRRAGHTDEGGRGLHLVAALSQRWGTRFLGDGKCIWTEQDLPPGP